MLGYEKECFLPLPTTVEYLPTLSKELCIELYIKREDLTNLGVGGNKLRKLQYFIHDAKTKGATMLITIGGVQTNHGRLTAAVAAKYGMKCAIIAMDDYPGELSANLLLDRIMGAEVVLHKNDGTDVMDVVKLVTDRYEAQGEKVYFIPMGGSNELGALGYYECAQELIEQVGDGHVIVAIGSMGTYMGLFCGLHHSALKLTGILIGPFYDDVKAYAAKYFKQCKTAWNLDFEAMKSDFNIKEDYIRGGYNNPVKEVREAIYEMGRKEAILLDPCYTGKTFAAIRELVASGEIQQGEKVIFIHTGGLPGIYTLSHRMEMEKELISGITIIE